MLCPTCNSELFESVNNGINVDECVACGAYWFNAGEIEKHITVKFPDKKDVPSLSSRFEPSECSYEEFCPKCEKQKLACGRVGQLSLSKCERCSGILITKDQLEGRGSSACNPLAELLVVELVDGAIFTILDEL